MLCTAATQASRLFPCIIQNIYLNGNFNDEMFSAREPKLNEISTAPHRNVRRSVNATPWLPFVCCVQ